MWLKNTSCIFIHLRIYLEYKTPKIINSRQMLFQHQMAKYLFSFRVIDKQIILGINHLLHVRLYLYIYFTHLLSIVILHHKFTPNCPPALVISFFIAIIVQAIYETVTFLSLKLKLHTCAILQWHIY